MAATRERRGRALKANAAVSGQALERRCARGLTMVADGVRNLPVGRHLAIDERGVGLRATWRLDRGFVNLSFWRNDTCVETFRLDPGAAAALISFLVQGLAEATTTAAAASVHALAAPQARPGLRRRLADQSRTLRAAAAQKLVDLGEALRPG